MKSRNHPLCLVALVLSAFGGQAHAELVSSNVTAFSVATDPATLGAAYQPPVAQAGTSQRLAAQPLAAEGPASGFGSGSLSSATPSTLSLWTFITSIRAQQQGDRFSLLETHVSLLQLAEPPAAPVPLPGALWFMVVGLLGMAGVRVSGSGSGGSAAQGPALANAVM